MAQARKLKPDEIFRNTSKLIGWKYDPKVIGSSGILEHVLARRVLMILLRRHTRMSFPEIAAALCLSSHSTVVDACNGSSKVTKYLAETVEAMCYGEEHTK